MFNYVKSYYNTGTFTSEPLRPFRTEFTIFARHNKNEINVKTRNTFYSGFTFNR